MAHARKYGKYDLAGPAIDRLHVAADDNHAEEADMAEALANFKKFSSEFKESQLSFLSDRKLK